tara:strand:- start:224 stop:643 length:420 start_codon:yes stop_codon:yes gene_type:complete
MKSFKDFVQEYHPGQKVSLPQINSYLSGLNRMLSVADIIKHLKKHFKLSNVKMDRNGTKVLAIEAAKRDYKAEYKKFQSSPERIKYRAELVKYNRDKGTYGNGDGKDASHKGGKIVGFEKEGKNRGRAEASRCKGSKRK